MSHKKQLFPIRIYFQEKKIMEKEIYRRDLEHPPKKNSKKKYPVFQISSL